jgi:hypothetical protein
VSDSSAEIRIDQSHCNYYLSRSLAESGWKILFIDPGRSSRGGGGSQGQSLRVFEENGGHIPDIVAVKNHDLLLIEIDSAYRRACKSIAEYRQLEGCLIDAFSKVTSTPINRLLTGFCRTGKTVDPVSYVSKMGETGASIDLISVFTAPRIVLSHWLTHAEK